MFIGLTLSCIFGKNITCTMYKLLRKFFPFNLVNWRKLDGYPPVEPIPPYLQTLFQNSHLVFLSTQRQPDMYTFSNNLIRSIASSQCSVYLLSIFYSYLIIYSHLIFKLKLLFFFHVRMQWVLSTFLLGFVGIFVVDESQRLTENMCFLVKM